MDKPNHKVIDIDSDNSIITISSSSATTRHKSAKAKITATPETYEFLVIENNRKADKFSKSRRSTLPSNLAEAITEEYADAVSPPKFSSTATATQAASTEISPASPNDVVDVYNKVRMRIRTPEELLDSSSDLDVALISEESESVSQTPPETPFTIPAPPTSSPTPVPVVSPSSPSVPIMSQIVTRQPLPPASDSPTSQMSISFKHYERLIEELKCPGCAYPMKAPIKLCNTGHSVCDRCTKVLMLCPLCKEPFSTLRSLTVEALCSKAHFRCSNTSGGCKVRLQIDLLPWHEKQCIYKHMKCFMGRVWGDCTWTGREANWKDHLETDHANKVFTVDTVDLCWDMSGKLKPISGYYVFVIFDEMFNFYQIYDKDRALWTMTCTSTTRDKKYNFAYEVEMVHEEIEALAITQKFPVHSEYDSDILAEGTCVNVALTDLARFIGESRILHYRVRLRQVKSSRNLKIPKSQNPTPSDHPINFQLTKIEGGNLKYVPAEKIVTRKLEELPFIDNTKQLQQQRQQQIPEDEQFDGCSRRSPSNTTRDTNVVDEEDSDSDHEFNAFVAKQWGTPQYHFNRKYLKSSASNDSSPTSGSSNQSSDQDGFRKIPPRCRFSGTTSEGGTGGGAAVVGNSYKKKTRTMSSSLRKSFKNLKSDIIEMKPFGARKSPEKSLIK